jgi:hypothetical protein
MLTSNGHIGNVTSATWFPLLDGDGRTYLQLEHSDLLKLKSAVEKAMEVTPKPVTIRYKLTALRNPGMYSVLASHDDFRTDELSAEFPTADAAREYVAFKNAQGEK